MANDNLPNMENCPLPAALEAIGERWSFLILRGAMFGTRHFEDFQATLGIARNILSNRLARLVERGVMTRCVMDSDKRRVEYRLTAKGRALAPVMIGLRQWAEKWERGAPCSPVLVDKRDMLPVRDVVIMAHDGRVLDPSDMRWENLPGDGFVQARDTAVNE